MAEEVARSEVALGEKVSEGAESVVFIGDLRGQKVAVKKYKIRTTADLHRFGREVDMMSHLRHPNVISCLAVQRAPPDRMVLMPLAATNLETEVHKLGWRPGWEETLCLAAQLAHGVSHLHEQGIVHCDIKPANILLSEGRRTAVIADLGISEYITVLDKDRQDRSSLLQGGGKPTGGFHKKRLVGTLQYMAPEVLLKEPQSCASDVYAWAVTVNEMATGTVPFSDCTKDNPACHTVLEMGYGQAELAAAVVSEGLRPLLRPDTPLGLVRVLEACWRLRPEDRPTMQQVMEEVRAVEVPAPTGPSVIAHSATEHLLAADLLAAMNGAAGCCPAAQAVWESMEVCAAPKGTAQALVSAGGYATAGLRGTDKMEDRHVVLASAGRPEGGPVVLGVFDGHRGEEAAEFVAQHLEAYLGAVWSSSCDPGQALRSAFVNLDRDFVREQQHLWEERVGRMGAAAAGPRVHWPGCTALAATVVGNHLYIANAGDCRGVLCRSGKPVQVTRDHSTADDTERQRIVDVGGKLSWRVDSWRVGEAGIQVTRSIGDYDLRQHGLTPDPEVSRFELTGEDEFLVLASDGLFDVLSNEEVVGLVHDTVKEPSMCGKRLATEALTRGSNDNITAVVAFLQPVSTLESIYSNGHQKYEITRTLYGTRQEMLEKYAHARAADEVSEMCY